MMILTYIFYYFISILTLVLDIYFCRFTEADYEYNPSLKNKRRYLAIWTFALMCILQPMVIGARILFIYPVTNTNIVLIAYGFAISYAFLLDNMLRPKPTRKKKRKFK